MSDKSELETEVAELMIESLNLEDVAVDEIDPEAALFREGLGLDSIDALELSMAISQKYGFKIESDSKENQAMFASLRALSAYIETKKK
ncbi:MAG: xanthomonadin biosynthesis acyl carrier protein XanC [Gammaproteobacteria bacterium]|nr:MAG: xanthomonadin biosynthesis acyl carrier protein XanC [Gammaproteobacteria bacterium]